MKLPAAEHAYVPPDKLTRYLLSLTHPVGRSKAAYFRALGYDEENVGQLSGALLRLARTGEVRIRIETDYGVKFILLGELQSPSGQTARVLTVWIVNRGQTAPRFVTAYPFSAEESSDD